MRRIIRNRPSASSEVKTKALELLQTIAETDQTISEQIAIRAARYEQLQEYFKLLGNKPLEAVTPYGLYVADMVTPVGRSSKEIDVVAFRKKVGDDKEFMACVKVIAEKAKQVLSGKELAAVTHETPAEKKDPVFSVSLKKASTRGKAKE